MKFYESRPIYCGSKEEMLQLPYLTLKISQTIHTGHKWTLN